MENYFSREKISQNIFGETDPTDGKFLNDSRKTDIKNLLISRSPHLCTFQKRFDTVDEFQSVFKQRYDDSDNKI